MPRSFLCSPLVLLDDPGNRKEYDGQAGESHANVADAAVAADVAQWLDEIERQFGDMRPFPRTRKR